MADDYYDPNGRHERNFHAAGPLPHSQSIEGLRRAAAQAERKDPMDRRGIALEKVSPTDLRASSGQTSTDLFQLYALVEQNASRTEAVLRRLEELSSILYGNNAGLGQAATDESRVDPGVVVRTVEQARRGQQALNDVHSKLDELFGCLGLSVKEDSAEPDVD